MSNMLGLVSGKTFADNTWNTYNTRRRIFHDYPTGEFPLTGLLSMMDTDWTDSPEFAWQEKTWLDPETVLVANGTTSVPFTATGGTTSLGSTVSFTQGQEFRIYFDDIKTFRNPQILRIDGLPTTTSGVFGELYVMVVSRIEVSNALEVRVIKALANVKNTNATVDAGTPGPVGATVAVIGNANAEGSSTSASASFTQPFKPENYTQIFRDSFSITNTSAQVPTDFDAKGAFRNISQETLLTHMTGLEKSALFGVKSIEYIADEDGEMVPRRTMSGVTEFFKNYEIANSIYRGGAGAPALTSNDDDDKRIITTNSAGQLSWSFFSNQLQERLFRCTSNKGFEKLAICGSGFLGALNAYIETHTTANKNFRTESIYGMNVTTFESPFGIVRFASHPLFTRSIQYRNDVLFLDIHNIKLRPLKNRDTHREANQQKPGQDRVKHAWLTETSLEFRRPQSGMWLRKLKSFT